MSEFPKTRLRRLRRTEALRALVRETKTDVGDLVYPLFVVEGKRLKQEVSSMPGICRYSPDLLPKEVETIAKLGIPAVILFGIPQKKDGLASSACDPKGVIQQAIHSIKKAVPELLVVTDVCLCEYTSHGHCGVVVDGDVDNDKTLELLARTALSHAQAGADVVAPSDMMDGRVKAIRRALD
ncbi:MAG: porphobilinogen synthase, partial [Chloroflexi bacterium]|nr:porphobilinogen synthase [Chloroflexota bacterium]